MNAVIGFRRCVCCASAVAWCLVPGVALGGPPDTLSASASGLVGYDGSSFITASADSTRLDLGGGWWEVTDAIFTAGGPFGPSFDHPAEPGVLAYDPFSTNLFSWYSVTELPGATYFPKIFAGAEDGSNTWQTSSPLQVSPGVVRVQNVAFPNYDLPGGSTPYPPIFGPMNYFNALAWSADLSGGAFRQTSIGSGSLASSLSLGDGGNWEVRLESTVQPEGEQFRYEYTFENLTDETLTFTWDSAGLTRTLAPFETLTETVLSGHAATESQGYAHVVGDAPVADIVSMALVPMPEPGTLGLLVVGAAAALRRSRRR